MSNFSPHYILVVSFSFPPSPSLLEIVFYEAAISALSLSIVPSKRGDILQAHMGENSLKMFHFEFEFCNNIGIYRHIGSNSTISAISVFFCLDVACSKWLQKSSILSNLFMSICKFEIIYLIKLLMNTKQNNDHKDYIVF